MQDIFNRLRDLYGSHTLAAEGLGYTDRQYRNIRKKVEMGEVLPARIENLILMKVQELQANPPEPNQRVGRGYGS